jgi:hypothetical protein
MSIFRAETVPCPLCAEPVVFEVAHSVNADRRPDLREAILDGSFQRETCPHCATVFRMDPSLSYMHADAKLYLLVEPAAKEAQWPVLEAKAQSAFERSYGPGAGAAVREFAAGLQVRAVFGWAALREKLVAAEQGLDDATLELLKLSLIRSEAGALLGDRTVLRLVEVTADELVLALIDARTEVLEERITVPRGAYDAIAAAPEAWAPLRAELTAGPFVDLDRLLIAGQAGAA